MPGAMGLSNYMILGATSFAAALFAYWVLSFRLRGVQRSALQMLDTGQDTIAFLFDANGLIDTNDAGQQWFDCNPGAAHDWTGLIKRLSPRFPKLHTELRGAPDPAQANDPPQKQISIGAVDAQDASHVTIERWRGFTRLEIHPDDRPLRHNPDLNFVQSTKLDELENLRKINELSPFATWCQNSTGLITWANAAYLELCKIARPTPNGTPESWPPLNIFDLKPVDTKDTVTSRQSFEAENQTPLWFECTSVPTPHGTLHFALNVQKTVLAEASLREFRQTLSKTFAHLPTGLAIFDRKKHLALFNPALTDLTHLPIEFLSGKPSLFAVLDQLRSLKMMPEPKNYKTWRRQMSRLEKEAFAGVYKETWLLPGGQTYSIVGHPYPDGAVAFLLDDISSETALTHNLRQELNLNQAVLDGMAEAIAVFSVEGQLSLSNQAYCDLWKSDPQAVFGPMTIIDATRFWQEQCHPTPVWGDLREYVSTSEERAAWSADLRLRNDMLLTCKVTPIDNGATLVRFTSRSHEIPFRSGRSPALEQAGA